MHVLHTLQDFKKYLSNLPTYPKVLMVDSEQNSTYIKGRFFSIYNSFQIPFNKKIHT